jgi:uncharacterized membrane protein
MPVLLLTNNNKVNVILASTYIGYIGLLALFSYTYISNSNHSWKLLIFQSLPLLTVLPGIAKKHYRAHSWLCFIILAYFMAYVVEVGSPLGELTDWIGLTFSVIVFVGAMMSSRYLQRL